MPLKSQLTSAEIFNNEFMQQGNHAQNECNFYTYFILINYNLPPKNLLKIDCLFILNINLKCLFILNINLKCSFL